MFPSAHFSRQLYLEKPIRRWHPFWAGLSSRIQSSSPCRRRFPPVRSVGAASRNCDRTSAATAGVRLAFLTFAVVTIRVFKLLMATPINAYENGSPIDLLLIRDSAVVSVLPISGLAYLSPDSITFQILESQWRLRCERHASRRGGSGRQCDRVHNIGICYEFPAFGRFFFGLRISAPGRFLPFVVAVF